MEKTLPIHDKELQESIAIKIEALTDLELDKHDKYSLRDLCAQIARQADSK